MKTRLLILITSLFFIFFFQQLITKQNNRTLSTIDPRVEKILNQLRDEINSYYGTKITPRINIGPCGHFAKAFYEQWNVRFSNKCNIAFIMLPDGITCQHVVVKLPDSSYYDGGNGIMTEQELYKLIGNYNQRIEEMKEFNLQLLYKRSYSPNQNYPDCPNYSDSITTIIIQNYIKQLTKSRADKNILTSIPHEQYIKVLNELRDEINSYYGKKVIPRVNLGPGGRFAKTFYDQWNSRFNKKVKIAFVMYSGGRYCQQVIVRLPDGKYFDPVYGVTSEQTLLKLMESNNQTIEVMDEFNLKLLEKRSKISEPNYPECPNYSDSTTGNLIDKYLTLLSKE